MNNTQVFAPILQSSLIAITKDSSVNLSIPFEIPSIVNYAEVKHMQGIIIKASNNTIIDNRENQTADHIYYVDKNDIKNNIFIFHNVLNEEFEPGIYKIQLRFGYNNLWGGNINNFASWKTRAIEDGSFSEWSNVLAIKVLNGQLDIRFAEESTWFTTTLAPTFSASCVFNAIDDEYVDKYKFTLRHAGSEIETSGWRGHLATAATDTYKFKTQLEEDEDYEVVYSIISTNGYETSAKLTVNAGNNIFLQLNQETIFLQDESAQEEACHTLVLDNLKILKNYILVRTDEKSNYKIIDDLYSFQSDGTEVIYNDFTIENGIQYRYGLQATDKDQLNRSPIVWLEDVPVVYFEHVYLVHGDKQLKLKYDFKISSFKHTVLASKQDTLGSKYPTITRNGYAYYAEFPISGLISLQMDDNENFFATNKEIHNEGSGDFVDHNLTDYNRYQEKLFRDEVETFLNNGGYKLFKSATEGNMIVSLMNVSLTPNATLGRMIYNFAATAYEVAEASIENMHKLGMMRSAPVAAINENTLFLGPTIHAIQSINILDEIVKSVQPDDGMSLTLLSINNLSITNQGKEDITLFVNWQEIIIKAGRKYQYPLEINITDSNNIFLIMESENIDCLINYLYKAKITEKEDNYIYKKHSIWGQIKINKDMIEQQSDVIQTIVDTYTDYSTNTVYKLNKFNSFMIDAPAYTVFNIRSNDNIDLNSITQIDGGTSSTTTSNNIDIVIGETGIWNAPEGFNPSALSFVYTPNADSLILVNYQGILNSQTMITNNTNENLNIALTEDMITPIASLEALPEINRDPTIIYRANDTGYFYQWNEKLQQYEEYQTIKDIDYVGALTSTSSLIVAN